MPKSPDDPTIDLGETQEVHFVVPPAAKPDGPDPTAADPQKVPIYELAKQLGEPYWTRVKVPAGNGKEVVTYDGPGWVLAGVMAGNRLDEHYQLTKQELLELGHAVLNIQIGVHTHDEAAEVHQPAKKGA